MSLIFVGDPNNKPGHSVSLLFAELLNKLIEYSIAQNPLQSVAGFTFDIWF